MSRSVLPLSLFCRTLSSCALVPLFLCGCGGGGSSSPAAPPGTRVVPQNGWHVDTPAYVQPTKQWTVLVYMNGANDLEEFGTLNTNQMETVGSTDSVNIIVQFKRIKGQFDTSDGDWGGTRRYYVSKDSNTNHVSSPILSDRSDLNMGDPNSLQDFIQWGVQTYPAQHYCLVVWNHGAGWRSQKTPPTRMASVAGYAISRGVSYDDEFQINGYSSHIDTIQIPAAIDLGSGKKWDLLAWDASLMQMAEVAYQIRDKASYVVGSEESPPGAGFPYDQICGQLVQNPAMDGRTLGTVFAQQMLAANGSGSEITESVLDMSQVAALAPALDSLGSALTTVQALYAPAISDARSGTENYAYPENRDLQDFLQQLSKSDSITGQTVTNDSRVATAVNRVQTALNTAIIFNSNGSGHPHSNGLAVFLPSPFQYQQIDVSQANGFGQRYTSLALSHDAPHWQNFLATGPP